MIGVEKMICNCGCEVEECDTTESERNAYGCGRDKVDYSCCVGAMWCPNCQIRWLVIYESPEME